MPAVADFSHILCNFADGQAHTACIITMDNKIIESRDKILNGGCLTESEVYYLSESDDSETLQEAARAVTAKFVKPVFDSCSIVNARSGRCGENCEWCAQSAHWNTHCDIYDAVDRELCMQVAHENARNGIRRLSLVSSGKAASGKILDYFCSLYRDIKAETGLYTCASMGLLGRDELQKLWDAGVRRYHCNLETAPSHFATLCTTHTCEDKLRTIEIARSIGFEICSGGIIGMGETRRQRAEFALALRKAQPVSIPINILCPIAGTPLANAKPLSENEIIDAIAIMRMAHPTTQIRFAGGRLHLSREGQLKAIATGINGGIIGNLLTTVGATVDEDIRLVHDAGMTM